jgi:hypothetical protein
MMQKDNVLDWILSICRFFQQYYRKAMGLLVLTEVPGQNHSPITGLIHTLSHGVCSLHIGMNG